jgi:hypothetical protein
VIDWFIVIVPLLLALVCAPLAFAGCTGHLDGPSRAVWASLDVSALQPRPARVIFRWEIDGEAGDTVAVTEAQRSVVGGVEILAFEHLIRVEEAGELAVSCRVFTAEADGEERLGGSATCDGIQTVPGVWPRATFVFNPDRERQVTCEGVV